jgi:hypothetical protein
MIMTRGGPLPTTRYPTAPSAVWAIRTGADTTEAGPVEAGLVEPGPVEPGPVEAGLVEPGPVEPGPVEVGPVEPGPVEVVGEEPQAARATDSRAVTSPRPIPRFLVRLLVRVISACPHDPRGRGDAYQTSFPLTVSGRKCRLDMMPMRRVHERCPPMPGSGPEFLRRGLQQMGVHHCRGLVTLERGRPGQQLERRAGQRVLVRPAVYRLTGDLLRGRVGQRAQDHSCAG